MLAKLRSTKDPRGTRVFKTRFLVHHLLPSFFFSFFFLHFRSYSPSSSLLPSPQKPKPFLPSSSKSISQNLKPKSWSQLAKIQTPHLNPFLKIPNIPNPNHDLNRSKNPNPKITISSCVGVFWVSALLWFLPTLVFSRLRCCDFFLRWCFMGFCTALVRFECFLDVDFFTPPQLCTSWKSSL